MAWLEDKFCDNHATMFAVKNQMTSLKMERYIVWL